MSTTQNSIEVQHKIGRSEYSTIVIKFYIKVPKVMSYNINIKINHDHHFLTKINIDTTKIKTKNIMT